MFGDQLELFLIKPIKTWVKQRYGEIGFDLAANLRSDWF